MAKDTHKAKKSPLPQKGSTPNSPGKKEQKEKTPPEGLPTHSNENWSRKTPQLGRQKVVRK